MSRDFDISGVLSWIGEHEDRFLAELEEYLRIPSISTDPEHAADVRRCADFLRQKMEDAGLTAERIETDGHPLVYGEWMGAPGQPTLLFYGHYDVQPVDPLDEWRHPPFEPTLEGRDLVARGATDDKGQSFCHLKAVQAFLSVAGSLPVNVKFIVEGEEESGGESIETFVRDDRGERLGCDAVVISDSSMLAPGQPAMCTSLRGLTYMEIAVKGPSRDLHSGTYGGAVENPLNAMAYILAQLRDPDTGRIRIPGFYDDVTPLEPAEREELARLPFDEDEYRDEIGVDELRGEAGFSTIERTGARPTCDVHGVWGGYAGAGAKTVLPARGGAKVSMRLVPHQDPERIAECFRRYVEDVAPAGVEVEVKTLHTAQPVLIPTAGPLVESALDAMQEAYGKRPLRTREGGSIPIVATFSEVLEVPVMLLGFGLPDDRLHAPNEKFCLDNYYAGIRATAHLLAGAGEQVG